MLSRRFALTLTLIAALAGCSSFHRSDDAAAAKTQMPGMTREQVLACMGPAKKKSSEGATEVWSYLSTNGYGSSNTAGASGGGLFAAGGSHEHSFCTVNIVMKDGIVKAVHYNGPTASTMFAPDEQCGYAVANCVQPGLD